MIATTTRLDFLTPPPGFAPLTAFDLTNIDGAPGLFRMEDTAGEDLRLFLLDPAFYVPEYQPSIGDADLLALGVAGTDDLDLYVVTTIQDGAPVVNLLAPILVNAHSGTAVQLILEDDWPLQAELVPPAS